MLVQQLQKQHLNHWIIQKSKELGFFDCGISKPSFLADDAAFMETWIADGLHGEMSYLERNKDKRYDPRLLFEKTQSIITVLQNYYPPVQPQEQTYKVSKYAYGADYHHVLKRKLYQLLELIEQKTGPRSARAFVDSAPLLDRAWAQRSGLGFVGKNTCLINKKGGSFFFIGHLLIDLDLDYSDHHDPKNYCGSCTRCIDSCPTKALSPFMVDANKCLSYLTIEYRGDFSDKQHINFENNIYGCDICQDVCPWNRFSVPHTEPDLNPSDLFLNMKKEDWEGLDKPLFNQLFKRSAVQRAGYRGLKRNIDFVANTANFEDK